MKILQAIKRIDWVDVAKRAVWTFLQAFLAVFIISGESIIDLLFTANWDGLLALAIATAVAGTAAGLSAVKTIALELLQKVRVDGEL